MVLICFRLVITDIENSFLLAVCMSSLEKYLFKFLACISIGLLFF